MLEQATASAPQPIETAVVEPGQIDLTTDLRPTETRYGWTAFGDMNLTGGDGTINLFVQPPRIVVGRNESGEAITLVNPLHRMLPKSRLIPFPSFDRLEQMPSETDRAPDGRPLLVSAIRNITALDAIVLVYNRYAAWGFTIFNSMQGLPQDMAARIFQVVHPLDFNLAALTQQFDLGYVEQRIDSQVPITFSHISDFAVQPLRSEREREIAAAMAEEMRTGLGIAFDLATEILNETETSMVSRHSGGVGKTGPDALDRRLCAELNRTLPVLIGSNPSGTALEQKMDQVVELATRTDLRTQNMEQQAEIERLRKQLAGIGVEIEDEGATIPASATGLAPEPGTSPTPPGISGTGQGAAEGMGVDTNPSPTENGVITRCGHIKGNGEPCRSITRDGAKCSQHDDSEDDE
jgi:hypothetical protein